jgi:hypothetical protein
VADALQLSKTEAGAFWPLYAQYRAEMDKVSDGLVKLVLDYAKCYPEVPEDRAKQMLKDLTSLEKQKLSTRSNYLKKFGKVLPAAKNLRFAQVENRLDLALQIKLAAGIPMVPITGRIAGELTGAVATAEGVAGGAIVQTYQVTAEVIAINPASRRVTLLSPDGIKQTVKVGPDAVNFDQIHLGDKVKARVTQDLVVQVAGIGESLSDQTISVVSLAPQGAKPGGVVAEVTRVTATVTAIDTQKRTATLCFQDGSTRTVAVRGDVDLGKRKVGETVVFGLTETVAISVEKP